MHLNKMNELTNLSLNLINNNIEEIELNKWLEWSEKLVDLSLDLKRNRITALNNKIEDCEVYLDL